MHNNCEIQWDAFIMRLLLSQILIIDNPLLAHQVEILWAQIQVYVLPQSLWCCMQYQVILIRVLTTPNCITKSFGYGCLTITFEIHEAKRPSGFQIQLLICVKEPHHNISRPLWCKYSYFVLTNRFGSQWFITDDRVTSFNFFGSIYGFDHVSSFRNMHITRP